MYHLSICFSSWFVDSSDTEAEVVKTVDKDHVDVYHSTSEYILQWCVRLIYPNSFIIHLCCYINYSGPWDRILNHKNWSWYSYHDENTRRWCKFPSPHYQRWAWWRSPERGFNKDGRSRSVYSSLLLLNPWSWICHSDNMMPFRECKNWQKSASDGCCEAMWISERTRR